MKKLTDVYIKVTKQNQEELSKITYIGNLPIGEYLIYYDDVLSSFEFENENGVEGLKKVSLTELKRLIDTIPTREEIKRLKQQISAYKMNYDKVVKHSLSKEDELEFLRCKVKILTSLEIQNEELSKMYDDLVVESAKKQNSLKNLYDDALIEIEKLKDIKDAIQKSKYLWQDESERLRKENEQLKNRKWWQIWK